MTELPMPPDVALIPPWVQYDPVGDVLVIHGKRYAAGLFGPEGFLAPPGTRLEIVKGSDDVVTCRTLTVEAQAPTHAAVAEPKLVDAIMEQAQVFASAWSLVGSRFDNGQMLEQAEAEKDALRAMLTPTRAAAEIGKADS